MAGGNLARRGEDLYERPMGEPEDRGSVGRYTASATSAVAPGRVLHSENGNEDY